MDVSTIVTTLATDLAPIAAIGLAVMGVIAAIKLVKWVRRAF